MHHQVVIVGGGEAGLLVAGRLLRESPGLDVAIIEPSGHHDFQRMWLMVGSGVLRPDEARRDKGLLMPKAATWIKNSVCAFDPQGSSLRIDSGANVTYDFLIVAPGLQTNWHLIPGLRESLGRDGVCSVYSHEAVATTWEFIRGFRGGVALFTQPFAPIKSPYGSNEICFLAEEHFRESGVRDQTQVIFASAAYGLFPIRQHREVLEAIMAERLIETRLGVELIEVRGATKDAIFRDNRSGQESVIGYDLLHVAPPMGPPDFIAQSELAGLGGWVDVDQYTLQHRRFSNVFGIGDASSLPAPKMGASIRYQVAPLVANLLSLMEGRTLTARYDGYTSCPIMTGYDSLLMAEFDYNGIVGDSHTRPLSFASSPVELSIEHERRPAAYGLTGE